MEKVIVSGLLIIASIITAVLTITVLAPQSVDSKNSLLASNRVATSFVGTNVNGIKAVPDDENGATISAWFKNVGSVDVEPISVIDVFLLTGNRLDGRYIPFSNRPTASDSWVVVQPADSNVWARGENLQIRLTLDPINPISPGAYMVSLTTPNGVSTDISFEYAQTPLPTPPPTPDPISGFNNLGLMLNVKKAPFHDPRVRKAIQLAIDYQQLNNLVLGGISGIGCPLAGLAHTPSECETWPGLRPKNSAGGRLDIEKAKQLMADSGYPDGFQTTYDARQVGSFPDTCSVIKQQLKVTLGINGEITTHESAAGYALYETSRGEGDEGTWEIACQNDGQGSLDVDGIVDRVYQNGAARNYTDWHSDKADELFMLQKLEPDYEKRIEINKELETFLFSQEDNHWITLGWGVASLLANDPTSVPTPTPGPSGGLFVRKWGTAGSGDGEFQSPAGISVAPDGSVYVADRGNNRIQKFTSGGVFVSQWGMNGTGEGEFQGPFGVAVALDDGSVYVTDVENHRIQKFTSEGVFVSQWGTWGSDDGEFYYPTGVAVASDGSVYVTDVENHRIQKFTSAGVFVSQWGTYGSGDGEFYNPEGAAAATDGSVYVADTDNNRIQKFNSDGSFVSEWGTLGTNDGEFNIPHGVAVVSDGSVYVTDVDNQRIQKFNSDGVFVSQWGTYGEGDGEFHVPLGVAVASDGSVYVADSENHRIQQFSVGQ